MADLDRRDAHRLYVRMNVLTGILYEDEVMCAGVAARLNEELDFEGSVSRWMPYGTREGDAIAA
jgi:hypothetical protein